MQSRFTLKIATSWTRVAVAKRYQGAGKGLFSSKLGVDLKNIKRLSYSGFKSYIRKKLNSIDIERLNGFVLKNYKFV